MDRDKVWFSSRGQLLIGWILLIRETSVQYIQESKGYRMGEPWNRDIKCTHSLFLDDLKVYQKSHKILKDVNQIIVQASHDTGACYGAAKCTEIVFEPGKMVKSEGLQVLQERIKAMETDQKEIYKFLGVEQADGIKTKVNDRVKEEVTRRVKEDHAWTAVK